MKTNRTLTTFGGLMMTALLAWAQDAPPAPPVAATPAVPAVLARRPAPAAPVARDVWDQSPTPPAAPVAAMPFYSEDAPAPPARAARPARPTPPTPPAPMAIRAFEADQVPAAAPVPPEPPAPPTPQAWPMPMPDIHIDTQAIMDNVQRQLDNINFDFDFSYQQDLFDKSQKEFEKAQEKMAEANAKMVAKMSTDAWTKVAMQPRVGGNRSEDSMYQSGLREIDDHQYDAALSDFNNVIARGSGPRMEGAIYWKAYVLNKLGKAPEAQAAIDQLRKSYPNSTWLDTAKALELEVKQSKGPVSPESESDEEIKVLALNGLMQSDPEKYLPQVENMLKGAHSPKLRRQALIVIAQSNLPKAQQDLEQIARGSSPDLQVEAIRYLVAKRNPNTPQILVEIYTSTSDPNVKRAILDNLSNSRDKDRIFQLTKGEKDATLRDAGIRRLGDIEGQPELWQMYQSETTSEGKIALLNFMYNNGNLEKLTEVARTDKDPKVRQKAIEVIRQQNNPNQYATLVSLYSTEQDEKVKQTIINNVADSRDCKPLVDVARAEKSNLQLKVTIVRRLSDKARTCQAANDYLMEILNK